ncbi:MULTISPECIES: hypothetical protein [unclassified Sphingomonas]|uniref:hypothetical protein n=1 Tax=unclassified Sphingomonas TaxID=196159 RepID=UPI001F5889D5|nr:MULTISPECIES: hypothetical protein [unclassified Sphingomonas]
MRALNVLYDTLRAVAGELAVAPNAVRACDYIRPDLVDDVAFALGLWISPGD